MEVQTSRRRLFTLEFKADAVLTVISGQRNTMDLAGVHQLKPQQICEWKAEFIANAALPFQRDTETDLAYARIAELEHPVGRLTFELEAEKNQLCAISLGRKTQLAAY